MRRLLVLFGVLVCARAWASDDLMMPKVDFEATSVHEAGAIETRETVHYTPGKLRIDRANGFSTTILDLKSQTECLLMTNHTYLILPMDDELFRRFIARAPDLTGARKVGTERIEGLETSKFAFGEDGALDAAGTYWLTGSGIMVRREYEDGVFGANVHHLTFLTHIVFTRQPAALFEIPAGYRRAH